MASRSNQDTWLWIGLVALGYYSAMTVHRQLVAIQKATEITHLEKPHERISQGTENAIKLETLAPLTRSPDTNIRAAVEKIVTKRLFQENNDDSAWGILMRDLRGWNLHRRDKALALLRHVRVASLEFSSARSLLSTSDMYQRVVECLRDMLTETRSVDVLSVYHSQPERDALWLLNTMEYDTIHEAFVDVVGRWLGHYPFGGEDASDSNKQRVIGAIMNEYPVFKDSVFGTLMLSVLVQLHRSRLYRDSLIRHGLLLNSSGPYVLPCGGYGFPSSSQSQEPEPFVRASDDWDFTDVSLGSREIEQSPEEQALRRRRREAMVYIESGRPISREDIIERDPIEDVADEEVEEELEHLREEVLEARAVSTEGWLSWLSRLRPNGLAPAPAPANEWWDFQPA